MSIQDTLRELVAGWLPTQRWFAGKGREHTVEVTRLAELNASPQVTLWSATVDYGTETETYLLPLVARTEPLAHLDHVLLGTAETDAGVRWVYDALHDRDATPAWLLGIRDATTVGPVRFHRYTEPDTIPVDQPSLVLTGEQSNTSMVFGDRAILKVFRRLQPGINPDIEVQAALSTHGAANVAPMLGAVDIEIDGVPTSVAFLQEFMTSATDGWKLATASVRDLMAEADLHADEAVATVHTDLVTAFGVRESSADDVAQRAVAMHGRLDRAADIVPALVPLVPGLSAIYEAVASTGAGLPVQRIHGDLHLGQALRTVYRWVLIDFEGEPMAAIADRREFDSPLRDVAGMLRSFEYAGHHRVIDAAYDQQLNYRAAEWAERNRAAFLDGYAAAAGADPRTHDLLLRAYEADKAVYEAVYEARNRPAWLAIPLASLTRLASGGTP